MIASLAEFGELTQKSLPRFGAAPRFGANVAFSSVSLHDVDEESPAARLLHRR